MKKIYLLLKKMTYHMVEDMFILYSIIWSGVPNIEKRFYRMD